jgi:hypothetical protein
MLQALNCRRHGAVCGEDERHGAVCGEDERHDVGSAGVDLPQRVQPVHTLQLRVEHDQID